MKPTAIATLAAVVLLSGEASGKTAVDLLKEQPAPVFKEGHTLMPLTRASWPFSYELNVELAQRWGNALELDPGFTGEKLDSPTSTVSRLIEFQQANQNRYPTYVYARRVMHEWDKIQGMLSPEAWCRFSDGSLVLNNGKRFSNRTSATSMPRSLVMRRLPA